MLNFEATMADKKEIAHLKNVNATLLEALQYFVENVIIDKYDACDEPLNTAWNTAKALVRKYSQ